MSKARLLILRDRNQITLPGECVPENVNQYEYEILPDRSILLKPLVNIPASQLYYWTKRWQEGEKQAEDDIEQGQVQQHKNVNALMSTIRKRRAKNI